MRAIAIKADRLLDESPRRGPAATAAAQQRTRISRLRAVGLVLPGLLVMDALLVAGGFLGAVRLTPAAQHALEFSAGRLTPPLTALFLVLVIGFLLLGGMFGLYSRRSLLRPRQAVARAVRALFWSGAMAVAFEFLLALEPPGDFRQLLLCHALFLAVGVLTIRPLICRFLLRLAEVGPVAPRRLLVVGSTPEARRVAAALEADDAAGVVVVGLTDLERTHASTGQRWPRFRVADWGKLPQLAHALAVEEVLIASPSIGRAEGVGQAAELAKKGIETSVVPHLTRMFVDAAPVRRESGVPLLRLAGLEQDRLGLRLKRVIDLILAVGGSVVLLPIMLIIAGLIKITSPGPVFYVQTRVGKGGKPFRMLKFRSMVVSNDDSRHRRYVVSLLRGGEAAGTDRSGRPVYKIFDDPRVTLMGKLLRRMSLDELPQLLSVIRGEMSLIGPRPCLPFEYEMYEPWQRRRLSVTPGMTGLWQVSGRSLLSFEEMVLLDLYYVANWSFLLDLRLLWRTIPEVLYARGAR